MVGSRALAAAGADFRWKKLRMDVITTGGVGAATERSVTGWFAAADVGDEDDDEDDEDGEDDDERTDEEAG